MLSISFGIKLHGTLVTNLPISQNDMLGIEVTQIPVPGMVSLYEEHLTRTDLGYTINEWYLLTPEQRALEVAIQRIKGSIEYQKSKEQQRKMESNSRRK